MNVVSIGRVDREWQDLLAKKADRSASETKRLIPLIRAIAAIVGRPSAAEEIKHFSHVSRNPGRPRRTDKRGTNTGDRRSDMKKISRELAPDLLTLAGTAERDGNTGDALVYYRKMLEIDPTCTSAWLGKGRAIGWESTLSNVFIREALVAFAHAIESAPDEQKLTVAALAQADIVAITKIVYDMTRDDFLQNRGSGRHRQHYLKTAFAISDALEEITIWGPTHRPTLEQRVLIAKDVLNLGGNAHQNIVMRQRLSSANLMIARLDISYREPLLAEKTTSRMASRRADATMFACAFGIIIAAILLLAVKLIKL
jgi:hypothetical protein